jgi:hypothetical protein
MFILIGINYLFNKELREWHMNMEPIYLMKKRKQ